MLAERMAAQMPRPLFFMAVARAASIAFEMAGNKAAARIAMMAITTSISTRVKPLIFFFSAMMQVLLRDRRVVQPKRFLLVKIVCHPRGKRSMVFFGG